MFLHHCAGIVFKLSHQTMSFFIATQFVCVFLLPTSQEIEETEFFIFHIFTSTVQRSLASHQISVRDKQLMLRLHTVSCFSMENDP